MTPLEDRDVSLADTLCDLALLPVRLAMAPLMAAAPPEARQHLRSSYQEARAAARAIVPRSRLGRRARVSKVIVE